MGPISALLSKDKEWDKPTAEDIIESMKRTFEEMRDGSVRRVDRGPIYIPGCSDEAFEYAYSCEQSKIQVIMFPKQYDLYIEWGKRTGKLDG